MAHGRFSCSGVGAGWGAVSGHGFPFDPVCVLATPRAKDPPAAGGPPLPQIPTSNPQQQPHSGTRLGLWDSPFDSYSSPLHHLLCWAAPRSFAYASHPSCAVCTASPDELVERRRPETQHYRAVVASARPEWPRPRDIGRPLGSGRPWRVGWQMGSRSATPQSSLVSIRVASTPGPHTVGFICLEPGHIARPQPSARCWSKTTNGDGLAPLQRRPSSVAFPHTPSEAPGRAWSPAWTVGLRLGWNCPVFPKAA